MKVVHVSPAYFDEESIVGGGERQAQELARAMASRVATLFVSFGPRRRSYLLDNLQVEIFPSHPLPWRRDAPFSMAFLRCLLDADIVHCHQLGTPPNVLALLAGRLGRKRTFLTPLGLAPTKLEHRLTQLAGITGLLCISKYSAGHSWYRVPRRVIYGGVDLRRFHPTLGGRERKVVCVARLMPHKGINYLIEALEPDMRLEIYGRPYDERYYRDLLALSAGKNVAFLTNASDDDITHAYQTSLVAVLPSVHRDMYGHQIAEPELLGLTLLEAMACGTAVVGSRITSIPEYVEDGVTGYLVLPNDPDSLRTVLKRLLDHPDQALALGRRGHELVQQHFTWDAVVDRCLLAYAENTGIKLPQHVRQSGAPRYSSQ
jgi:glycosyltransferase involved in cell wall biosynthesis